MQHHALGQRAHQAGVAAALYRGLQRVGDEQLHVHALDKRLFFKDLGDDVQALLYDRAGESDVLLKVGERGLAVFAALVEQPAGPGQRVGDIVARYPAQQPPGLLGLQADFFQLGWRPGRLVQGFPEKVGIVYLHNIVAAEMAHPFNFFTPARPCISSSGPGRPQAHFGRTSPKSEDSTDSDG